MLSTMVSSRIAWLGMLLIVLYHTDLFCWGALKNDAGRTLITIMILRMLCQSGFTGGSNKNHPKEKEMQESKVAVQQGFTNSREGKQNAREIGKVTENGMQTSKE